MPDNKQPTFKVEVGVSNETLENLLCSAFEGGSNYWYLITDQIGEVEKIEHSMGDVYRDVVNGKAALMIRDTEDHLPAPVKLDREAIMKGLQIVYEKYPKHFADIIAENDDADTGDVLLQCAVLGDLIFG